MISRSADSHDLNSQRHMFRIAHSHRRAEWPLRTCLEFGKFGEISHADERVTGHRTAWDVLKQSDSNRQLSEELLILVQSRPTRGRWKPQIMSQQELKKKKEERCESRAFAYSVSPGSSILIACAYMGDSVGMENGVLQGDCGFPIWQRLRKGSSTEVLRKLTWLGGKWIDDYTANLTSEKFKEIRSH